ncbi:hypothetical protein CORC01_09954 [Colletotrichum orchidophilum]|uniref:Uncharacterized protein n=1 Tax=Colletotrichum orchidophilum TaxID=1209926 RepID=A0A1G4B014_9PEZI|nr:uncharacterized protein CORC01_09954 [Colletotrichum orchidophilum]OHE94737.1 hypothetical protein CORC01_09954 [Colletotrichum orchidophilum]
MSCGHTIRSRPRDCGKGRECEGERWQSAFLDDSCAACHRPTSYRQIRARHEAEHAVLMGDYMRAEADGDEAGMRRLRRDMLEHTRLLRQLNFAVSLIREEPYGNVKWPAINDEDTGSRCERDLGGASESEKVG